MAISTMASMAITGRARMAATTGARMAITGGVLTAITLVITYLWNVIGWSTSTHPLYIPYPAYTILKLSLEISSKNTLYIESTGCFFLHALGLFHKLS